MGQACKPAKRPLSIDHQSLSERLLALRELRQLVRSMEAETRSEVRLDNLESLCAKARTHSDVSKSAVRR